MTKSKDGYFRVSCEGMLSGARYGYLVDSDDTPYPDPVSRSQPDGPRGLSQLVDASAYRWSDDSWQGVDPGTVVAYELHIGTFTAEGTWRAAATRLPLLAELASP